MGWRQLGPKKNLKLCPGLVDHYNCYLCQENRWDGLVYLHGLLSEDPMVSELDRLVISCGDFALVTELWVALFVSELFRK